MNNQARNKCDRHLKTAIGAGLIAAICCFTPLLVLALAGLGLSGLIGVIDYFAFPILFASLGTIAFGLHMRTGRRGVSPGPFIAILVTGFTALLIWVEFSYALRITLAAIAMVAVYGLYLRIANSSSGG